MVTFQAISTWDGSFEVAEKGPDGRETILSRHPNRESALQWLDDHLKLLSLDDLAGWLRERNTASLWVDVRERLITSVIGGTLATGPIATLGGWTFLLMWLTGAL